MKWHFTLIFCLWTVVGSNNSQSSTLPSSPLEQFRGVKYLTYTKENQQNPLDIRNATYGDGQTTVFIVHGFAPTSLEQPLKLVKDIFDNIQNVSRVVVVSWIDYATGSTTAPDEYNTPTYYKVATQHVPAMASDLNEKFMYVRKEGTGRIEVIGHCIGSHVAAQAGKLFRRLAGDKVDKIIGLDPAGLYWSTHPNEALQSGIAKELMVFHTNMDKYGFPTQIESNDVLVNGGKKQPNCKQKLTKDICSHNEAWQAYANYLKKNSVPLREATNTAYRTSYVLCMDISESMRNNKRLTIAIDAAKQLISNVMNGTRLGIVTFNREAVAEHDIVQINGTTERNALKASLPKEAKGSTSIGAGLRKSLELMRKLIDSDDELCSTIILISDGEQTVGETPFDVLPELQHSCITINSIALGADASQDLENLSAETAGQVFYVSEAGPTSTQMADTIRALAYAYESEMDDDDRPIHLQTNEIELGNGEATVVPIQIEENIGRDTEIDLFADDIDDVDMTLTSPDGQVYSSESPEFSSTLMRDFFNIGLLEPGHYNLTVEKSQKTRRSVRSASDKAIVMVKTHELNKIYPVVRLDAKISNRSLHYPKSAAYIYAELRVDKFPVIHADVYADIKGYDQDTVRLKLTDTGTFPDELANDGVYTARIENLPKAERYSVTVTATSNGTAAMVTRKVDYFLRQTIDCRWPSCRRLRLRPFRRETDAGSIKLLPTNDMEDDIPPSSVTDLHATVARGQQNLVTLDWSCPSVSDIKFYDIRALIGDEGETFDDAYQLSDKHFVNATSNAMGNCTEDGKTQKLFINITDDLWGMRKENAANDSFELRFALKAVGYNDLQSERSNVAVAMFGRRQRVVNMNRCHTVYRRTKVGIFQIKMC